VTVTVTKRPAWAEVDLEAVTHNVAALVERCAPASVCAVVKADGYGHGAVEVARAAVGGGASWLAVAVAEEGAELRGAGLDAPILLLSEPSPSELDDVVALGLRPTVYRPPTIDGLASAVGRTGAPRLPVHLKVDTGMHRVGVGPAAAGALATAVRERPELMLEGVWTHCAVADEPGNPFTLQQHRRFESVLNELRTSGIEPPVVHAANSAAALDHPCLRYDLVRAGIVIYGLDPSPALHGRLALRRALSLKARVSHVQEVPAGDALSYGLRRPLPVDSTVATVPLGYADGVPRRLSAVGGEVLIRGRRRPLAGTVTMDQLVVDCGPDAGIEVGDEVVLLGGQGDEHVDADEWAARLDTINYEIVCGLSARVPRRYLR
jgi:alanine racemase